MSDGNLPPEIVAALSARSEADVAQQPSPGEIAAARRVDGQPARVPMSQAPAAVQRSAADRLLAVLGPNFKTVLASMLLAGFKVVELSDDEKKQVQEQLITVAREQSNQSNLAKPSVLKMVPRRRIIRPGD